MVNMGCLFSYYLKSKSEKIMPILFPIVVKNQLIVAFTGSAGSGKDTAGNFLKEEYGFEKMAFADPLKNGIAELFAIDREVLDNNILKERPIKEWNNHSPRKLMQWLGTDVLRKEICDEFFLNHMAIRLNKSNANNIVITDVRFDIEAEFIRWLGGSIIQIKREYNPLRGSTVSHVSEKGIKSDLIDFVVENNGTYEQLFEKLDLIPALR